MVTVLTARVGTNPTRVKFGAIIFVLIYLDGCWNTNTSTEPVKVLFCGRGRVRGRHIRSCWHWGVVGGTYSKNLAGRMLETRGTTLRESRTVKHWQKTARPLSLFQRWAIIQKIKTPLISRTDTRDGRNQYCMSFIGEGSNNTSIFECC